MKGAHSLEGLVLGADVEADRSSFDGQLVHAVILDEHLCVLRRPKLDERLTETDMKVKHRLRVSSVLVLVLIVSGYLVGQEQVFLHEAKASSDGQQLLLLLLLSGQVGEEHHLAALTFDLSDGSVHGPVHRSVRGPVHGPVRRALVFLLNKNRVRGVGARHSVQMAVAACLTSMTSSLLDR